ncbi:transposase-like protein [Paraburkholderia caledonica]|uniref:Transposase-like protein n=1 Tax=Paraburkholderia caledonica TaxID=134536 RepID=A0AB73INH5_9BURK|nr:transposase-like protein [Paraburkholderia caledonica]
MAQRLSITKHSLYAWNAKFDNLDVGRQAELDQNAEIRRLKAELKRVTEKRDILKSHRVLCKGADSKVRLYAIPS